MWDLGGWHKALGQAEVRETEGTTTKCEKRRERQHQKSGTNNSKMVVLEAIRQKAEPAGNSGGPFEAIWLQYQVNGNKYVVRSPSQSNTHARTKLKPR